MKLLSQIFSPFVLLFISVIFCMLSIWAAPLTGQQDKIAGLELGDNPSVFVRGKVLECRNAKMSNQAPTLCTLNIGGKEFRAEIFIASDGYQQCAIVWGSETLRCKLYYGSDSGGIVIQAPNLQPSAQLTDELSWKDPITKFNYTASTYLAFSVLAVAILVSVFQGLRGISTPNLVGTIILIASVILPILFCSAIFWALTLSNRFSD